MPKSSQTKSWTPEQREAHRAYQREYQRRRRLEKPEVAQAHRDYAKARVARVMADPVLHAAKKAAERASRVSRIARRPDYLLSERDKAHKNRYGIDLSQRAAMLEEQGGRCRLCAAPVVFGKPSKTGGAHLDHCHRTGQVRSVLCGKCNMSLGFFGDDPKRLRAAAEYLEVHARLAGAP